MAVRYRNKKTKKVATYSQPMPRLEASKDWERVDDKAPAKKSDGKA